VRKQALETIERLVQFLVDNNRRVDEDSVALLKAIMKEALMHEKDTYQVSELKRILDLLV
jgi:alanyl-tRNA synthetase